MELYLYSPSGFSWPVIGWPFPLPTTTCVSDSTYTRPKFYVTVVTSYTLVCDCKIVRSCLNVQKAIKTPGMTKYILVPQEGPKWMGLHLSWLFSLLIQAPYVHLLRGAATNRGLYRVIVKFLDHTHTQTHTHTHTNYTHTHKPYTHTHTVGLNEWSDHRRPLPTQHTTTQTMYYNVTQMRVRETIVAVEEQ